MSWAFKIIVGGESAVGKSTLLYRLRTGQFTENIKSTIGVDFLVHKVQIMTDKGPTEIILQLWDLGGQFQFQYVHSCYIKGASLAILIHDLSRKETAQSLVNWAKFVRSQNPEIPILLVASKADLVDPKEIVSYIKTPFFKQFNAYLHTVTSSKTGMGVKEVFENAAAKILSII